MTGGRVKRAEQYLKDDTFLLTYGDGLGDVDLDKLLSFHKSHNGTLTLTSVQPEGRFGSIDFSDENRVERFKEKPKGDGAWINGGFFVCEPEIFNYLKHGDQTIFERQPLEELVEKGKLYAYKHEGFWQCMDTLRDKERLNQIWTSENAHWKVWE